MAQRSESISKVAETTGYNNNCGFNCISHFLIRKIITATDEELTLMFKESGFQELKAEFAKFFQIPSAQLTPKILQDLFKKKYINPIDRELILGPVLRKYFGQLTIKKKEKVEQDADKQLDTIMSKIVEKELIDKKSLNNIVIDEKEKSFDNETFTKALKVQKALEISKSQKSKKLSRDELQELGKLEKTLQTLMGNLAAELLQFVVHFDNKKRIKDHEINPISTTSPENLIRLTDTLGIRLSWQSEMEKPSSLSMYTDDGSVEGTNKNVPRFLGNLLVYNQDKTHWEFQFAGDEKELKDHNDQYKFAGEQLNLSEKSGEEVDELLQTMLQSKTIDAKQFEKFTKKSLDLDRKVIDLGKSKENKMKFWNTLAESYGYIRDEGLREESRNLVKKSVKDDVIGLINAAKQILPKEQKENKESKQNVPRQGGIQLQSSQPQVQLQPQALPKSQSAQPTRIFRQPPSSQQQRAAVTQAPARIFRQPLPSQAHQLQQKPPSKPLTAAASPVARPVTNAPKAESNTVTAPPKPTTIAPTKPTVTPVKPPTQASSQLNPKQGQATNALSLEKPSPAVLPAASQYKSVIAQLNKKLAEKNAAESTNPANKPPGRK